MPNYLSITLPFPAIFCANSCLVTLPKGFYFLFLNFNVRVNQRFYTSIYNLFSVYLCLFPHQGRHFFQTDQVPKRETTPMNAPFRYSDCSGLLYSNSLVSLSLGMLLDSLCGLPGNRHAERDGQKSIVLILQHLIGIRSHQMSPCGAKCGTTGTVCGNNLSGIKGEEHRPWGPGRALASS